MTRNRIKQLLSANKKTNITKFNYRSINVKNHFRKIDYAIVVPMKRNSGI